MRRLTYHQLGAYLDAEYRRLHTDRAERWGHASLIVAAMTGQTLDEFPDYESPEEGQDLDAIEADLARNPMVVHVAAPE